MKSKPTFKAPMTSLALIVVLLESFATSLQQAVKYSTNIPHALLSAATESLDTLVDFGRAFLSRRRMQACGGSNSTVEDGGGFWAAAADGDAAAVSEVLSVMARLNWLEGEEDTVVEWFVGCWVNLDSKQAAVHSRDLHITSSLTQFHFRHTFSCPPTTSTQDPATNVGGRQASKVLFQRPLRSQRPSSRTSLSVDSGYGSRCFYPMN